MNLTFSHSYLTISGMAALHTDAYVVDGAPIVTLYGEPFRLRDVSIAEDGSVSGYFGRVTRRTGEFFKRHNGTTVTLRAAQGAAVLAHGLTSEMADDIVAELEYALPVPCERCGSDETHFHCFKCDDILDETLLGGVMHRTHGARCPGRKPAEIVIPMVDADEYRRETYGVLYVSAFVYRVAGSNAPTRIAIWDNTRRVNERNGERVQWGQYGPIDGGNGRYLDPQNNATDAMLSVVATPEATVISAHGSSTGSAASGQVWAEQTMPLRTRDVMNLVRADGGVIRATLRLTNNGHGVATY